MSMMNEPIDMICAVEEAIADLQAMIDARGPEPCLVSEIQRLDERIRHIEQTWPVFAQPA